VIRRGLRPVDDLAARLTLVTATNLSDRLTSASVPAELSPIVHRLNDLLGRLQSSFEREKSFTADAAHELRTPLAGLESALEVCARKDRPAETYATVVRDCLEVVRGMHGMIDNLLLLARADADRVPTSTAAIPLEEVLDDAWRGLRTLAESRSLQIASHIPPDLIVETDREKLLHVLSNLLDNAVRHANESGQISISAKRDDGAAVLRISNTGSQISAADAEHVFERFWRGDESRTDTGLHCGLGLSVCKKMMSVLDGRICATSEVGGEFMVEISLPASKLHPSFMVPA
jgi:two-component system heavy metal sensor histidine kinase CusS